MWFADPNNFTGSAKQVPATLIAEAILFFQKHLIQIISTVSDSHTLRWIPLLAVPHPFRAVFEANG
jgi:hypothetical protein